MIYTLDEIKDGTGFDPDARFERVTDYNGWANRETWAVALHINNDQGWQESVHEALREHRYDNDPGNDRDLDTMTPYAAGEIIRENVEERLTVDGWLYFTGDDHLPAALSRIAEDIGSLWRVDWRELGAAFLSDLDET